jgi:hypothetical protein
LQQGRIFPNAFLNSCEPFRSLRWLHDLVIVLLDDGHAVSALECYGREVSAFGNRVTEKAVAQAIPLPCAASQFAERSDFLSAPGGWASGAG